MRPIFPARWDWPSTIGNFILNFSALDVALIEILKRCLPEDKWAALRKRSFQERAERFRDIVVHDSRFDSHRPAFLAFLDRLEPIRDLRNHLAHATLVRHLSEDGQSCTQTLSLPRDVHGLDPNDARDVTFDELFAQLQPLADLTSQLISLGNQAGLK